MAARAQAVGPDARAQMEAAAVTRLRLTRPVAPEAQTHEAIVRALDMLLLPPAFHACYPAGHVMLSGQQAAKLYRAGLRRGIPDILVWHGGACYGLEVKRPGGTLSRTRAVRTRNGSMRLVEGQRETFDALAAAGMKIAVVDDVDGALRSLAAWGVPLRAHCGRRAA